MLFVTCLVIFVILLLFNAFLLFTRILLRSKHVSSFKPIIDPYLDPYKDRCYYWTGLQLLIRAVFFSLSALKKEYCVVSGLALIGALLCIPWGVVQPFNNKFKNVRESFALLNLLLSYLFTLHDHCSNASTAAAQYLILVVLLYFMLFVILPFCVEIRWNIWNILLPQT